MQRSPFVRRNASLVKGVLPSLAALAAALACGCRSGTPIGGDQSAELRPHALTRLESAATWTTCSTSGANCGGQGGIGTPVQSTFTVGDYAGRKAAAIWIGGGVSYGTAYWFEKNDPPSYQAEQLTMRTDFYIPSGSEYEAIEWDPQQVRGTRVFNFGLQANNTLGQWRFFDYVNKAWRPTGIAWTGLTQGVWHTLMAHYHTRGDTIVFDWLELDGVRQTPTQSAEQSAVVDPTYTQDTISLGLQLDQAKSGASYSVYYDHVTLAFQCNDLWCRLPPTPPACGAPTIAAPTQGASVGTTVELAAEAPVCTARIDCYLDGDSTPAASAAGAALDRSLPVAVGDHAVRCNGVDATGEIYVTPPVGFSAVCQPPAITSPTAGQSVSGSVQLTAAGPTCITAINCYLDGNPTPVAQVGGNQVNQSIAVSSGSHAIQCNGWDSTGAVYVSPTTTFTGL